MYCNKYNVAWSTFSAADYVLWWQSPRLSIMINSILQHCCFRCVALSTVEQPKPTQTRAKTKFIIQKIHAHHGCIDVFSVSCFHTYRSERLQRPARMCCRNTAALQHARLACHLFCREIAQGLRQFNVCSKSYDMRMRYIVCHTQQARRGQYESREIMWMMRRHDEHVAGAPVLICS